jgi:cellulose synthase operon protein C
MKFFNARWKRWTFVLVTLAVLTPVGYWGARRVVWPKVKAMRAEGMNKEAREFLARGDNANALITARKILGTSTTNVEAWRIATAAARNRETPEVVGYQTGLARAEPTKANYLELIRLALRYNALTNADEAIKAIGPKASDDAEFHSLSAQFYQRIGRPVAAKYALVALTQLQPSNKEAQLELAELELAEESDRAKQGLLRARVRALAEDPALRVRALTLLLRDSIKARLPAETGELIAKLQLVRDLSVEDRLLLIEGASLVAGPSLPVLEKLQADVSKNPADVMRVMQFLYRTNAHEKSVAWFATLPEDVKKDEGVRRAAAESMLMLGKWPELEAHLKSMVWPSMDFLRHAMLAYSYRARSRTVEFNEAWNAAVVGVGSTDRQKILGLMRRTEEWKWNDERYDLVWKLFTLLPNQPEVHQALIAWEKAHGRTANLNNIFARIVAVDPDAKLSRNNLAYTSLLLDLNATRANLDSAELVAALPDNPFVITTYAFSLFKQGKPAEALAKIETLSPSQLSEPNRVLLRAVFLARLGQSERAIQMLKGIDLAKLLPEERKLAESALAEVARNARTESDKSRLGTMAQTPGGVAGGWLTLVSPETREAASVEMKLSDSEYASGDWTGLQTQLRRADWKSENYLRLALLAYATRAQSALQSGDFWKQAILATDRNVARAENLKSLATHWGWTPERVDALNVIFQRNPADKALMAELTKYYREAKRTRELVNVLTAFVDRTSDSTEEAVAQTYYSLISDTNLSRAHTRAQKLFEGAPQDPTRRLVYALSLWKSRRTAEASTTLTGLKTDGISDLVPVGLIRAAINADVGHGDEARSSLALFNRGAALPEEAALADKIALQLSKQAESGNAGKK